jgi:hypothetical protein
MLNRASGLHSGDRFQTLEDLLVVAGDGGRLPVTLGRRLHADCQDAADVQSGVDMLEPP